jgi:beta-glucuronidase
MLYATPAMYLDDVLVNCRLDGGTAHLNIFVAIAGSAAAASAPVVITLKDAKDLPVARGRMPSDPRRGGRLQLEDPKLWWPRHMSATPGYLYTIVVEVLGGADGAVTDVYRLKYGVRTVEASPERGFLINGRPFYFAGFGKHEDSELRGRALDLPQLIKDMSLLQWTSANSVRTTHYPYSDEFLQLCDETGIAVIAEAPAVGLQAGNMVRETLRAHLDAVGEMVTAQGSHPSIVMWSVANEPDSEAASAAGYFKHLVTQTKALDPSRPVTFASFKSPEKDVAAQYVDVIMVNRYYGWYTATGQLDVIPPSIKRDVLQWRRAFGKPIILSEFGADAVAGVHADPPVAFSEEFQSEYLLAHYPSLNALRSAAGLVGEHVWNFADFMTPHGVTRVVGNRKGVFTRSRQPKLAAHTVRSRYLALANATERWPLSLAATSAMVGAEQVTRARAPPLSPVPIDCISPLSPSTTGPGPGPGTGAGTL